LKKITYINNTYKFILGLYFIYTIHTHNVYLLYRSYMIPKIKTNRLCTS